MLLYYITNRTSFLGTAAHQYAALLRRVADAARAGVDYIQLREKDLTARELERLAHEAVQAVRNNSPITKLLINGRTDVALASGAAGVHLPTGELSASEVRAVWHQCTDANPLVGVSAHTMDDVRCAYSRGADFVVLAPIFEKVNTGAMGIGLEALRAACAGLDSVGDAVPYHCRFAVLGLGGITLANAPACIQAGAAGVAGIRLFQQGDVFETVRRLKEL